MKTKENGVTLVALVTTIIMLLILASIGATVGISTLNSARFTQFKSELKVMQNKINELNQSNEKNIGQELPELTDDQKGILNIEVISNIIYKDKSYEEKTNILNGFRYWSADYIQKKLNLDSIKRDYLINVEYRYVIFKDGFEYEGTTYYIIDQLENEFYNVRYKDKNEKTGSFEVTATQEDNKWKIEISDIAYNGYISNWQVKYKLDGATHWETSDSLTFYLRQEGTYTFNVVYEDKVDLGTVSKKIMTDGLISNKIKNDVIEIGDYVKYAPDTLQTTDTAYTNLISDLETYSGNTDTTQNTSSTITQESLNWRVLDIVKDEDGNSCVRLISEIPTTSTVTLYGAKGYNNAVYLLDETCSTLYNNSTYAKKVQSLKIEDIQNYLTYDYTQYTDSDVSLAAGKYGGTKTYNGYYPNIFAKETTGWVDGLKGTELGLSEQITPIDETSTKAGTSIEVTQTHWTKEMISEDFKDSIYYNLFMNDGISNYSDYWMSSRCVFTSPSVAHFIVRRVFLGKVGSYNLYYSDDQSYGYTGSIRPIITLNADILINAEESGDGSSAENAWIIQKQ